MELCIGVRGFMSTTENKSKWIEFDFLNAIHGAHPYFVMEHLFNALNERILLLGLGTRDDLVVDPKTLIGERLSFGRHLFQGRLEQLWQIAHLYDEDLSQMPAQAYANPRYSIEWAEACYKALNSLYTAQIDLYDVYCMKFAEDIVYTSVQEANADRQRTEGVFLVFTQNSQTGWIDGTAPVYLEPSFNACKGLSTFCFAYELDEYGTVVYAVKKSVPAKPYLYLPTFNGWNHDRLKDTPYVFKCRIFHSNVEVHDYGNLVVDRDGVYTHKVCNWATDTIREQTYGLLDISDWLYPEIRLDALSGFSIGSPDITFDFSSRLEYFDKIED